MTEQPYKSLSGARQEGSQDTSGPEPDNVVAERVSKIGQIAEQTKRAMLAAVIVAELAPTNEAIRFGAFGAAQAISGDPAAGAAVLGGSTFVVEGAAALAASEVLDTEKGGNVVDSIRKRLDKHISPDTKLSPVGEAGLAMVGGSAVVTLAKHIEDPSRTLSESRKHGLFTATWMAGYFAVEGALVSSGINHYNQPEKVGAALLGTAALVGAGRWAKNRINNKKQKEVKTDE